MVTNSYSGARSALVLYGSETGNAHDIAEELGRIVERLHFWTQVSCLDAVEPSSLLKFSLVIIAISTTGQGALPINARSFWKKLLRRKLPETYLQGVSFTIFGLGDSSYPKFNWAARKLQKRLLQLSADEFHIQGEADEQHIDGIDASFVPWSADLRQCLHAKFPLDAGLNPIPDDVLLQPKWTLSLVEDIPSPSEHSFENRCHNLKFQAEDINAYPLGGTTSFTSQTMAVTLKETQRMTPIDHWQDVRHLVFTSQSSVNYMPGDVLTVYPKNRAEDVDILLSLMKWGEIADKLVHFTPGWSSKESSTYPLLPTFRPTARQHMTLRTLLNDHLDLMAIPRRSFFAIIAHFAHDQTQKERLIEFTKPEYIDELYDYTSRPRRSILEVLQEFDSVQIPWQWATNVLPELRGRQFSVASGGQLKFETDVGTRFEILVAIVRYRTVIKKIREGVCTRYLASLPVGVQIRVTLQRGGLGITRSQANRPVIMIGPGTGVAPMRSLVWERLHWNQTWKDELPTNCDNVTIDCGIRESVLFFGCRQQNADFFYNEEWHKLKEKMPLQVFTAFSRDQNRKVYVQDIIKQQSKLVYRLLYESEGIVYVCGSSGKMPQSVRKSIIEVFAQVGCMTLKAAEEYLQAMEKGGRYKQETW